MEPVFNVAQNYHHTIEYNPFFCIKMVLEDKVQPSSDFNKNIYFHSITLNVNQKDTFIFIVITLNVKQKDTFSKDTYIHISYKTVNNKFIKMGAVETFIILL